MEPVLALSTAQMAKQLRCNTSIGRTAATGAKNAIGAKEAQSLVARYILPSAGLSAALLSGRMRSRRVCMGESRH